MRAQAFLRAVLVALLALAPFGWPRPAQAALISVTTTNDELETDGNCSLREAIQAVNTRAAVDSCAAGTGNDTIVLPAGLYPLTISGSENDNLRGDLDVFPQSSAGGVVTIQGAGAGATILDGNELDRVFHLIRSDSTLILRDLTIRNGKVTNAAGGGILSWGRLELRSVILENNRDDGSSTSDSVGGGLCIGCGPGTGSGVLENVIIRNNAADRGGGIFSNRPLTITASSIISNTARAGGAIINFGDLTVVNSTVSGNAATINTGGILHSAGSLSLRSSTIAYNRRAGVSAQALLTTTNTIIAFNTTSGVLTNCFVSGAVTSLGSNLSNDATCASWFTASGDLNSVDPRLGPLQENGGFTPTHNLLLDSPAVNAGSNDSCPSADQRGVARPQGARCDIGAVERVFVYLPLAFR
ncbi:MAG: CSLREA domain-containing protein [Chloroflexota bacterium]|nr:CSLREA domain-containing protein [Dehalococcoidia bacterium]MDW8253024.1 CSLREA domain-containing protein [Chloroflexota bacterium]